MSKILSVILALALAVAFFGIVVSSIMIFNALIEQGCM